MNTWTTTLLEDPNDPEGCIITFSEEAIAELRWVEGDTLNWEIQDDGTAIITKVNR